MTEKNFLFRSGAYTYVDPLLRNGMENGLSNWPEETCLKMFGNKNSSSKIFQRVTTLLILIMQDSKMSVMHINKSL